MRRSFVIVAITALAGACTQREAVHNTAGTERPAGFVDRVWAVAESPGGPGGLYVFLSDGTFVRAAKEAAPDVGKWSWDGKRLTFTQSALVYEADIDSLTESYFRITIHFMERSWELGLIPATPSMPDTTRPVEFDPVHASINVHGSRPVWLFSIENDRAMLRFARRTVQFTAGEWVQDCASVWDYTAYSDDETIEMQLSTEMCVDGTSGAEYPLHAILHWEGRSYRGCAVAGKLPAR